MGIESHRRKNAKHFIERFNITYYSKIKSFFQDMGIEVAEDLKLVEDDE